MTSEGMTVAITHTTANPTDDAVDPNTLKPVPVAGETPTSIYSGRCLLFPRGNRLAAPTGAPIDVDAYDLLLPLTAPNPAPGDKATILTASDSTFVNAELIVEAGERSSIEGARVVHVRDLIPSRPIHG